MRRRAKLRGVLAAVSPLCAAHFRARHYKTRGTFTPIRILIREKRQKCDFAVFSNLFYVHAILAAMAAANCRDLKDNPTFAFGGAAGVFLNGAPFQGTPFLCAARAARGKTPLPDFFRIRLAMCAVLGYNRQKSKEGTLMEQSVDRKSVV